ncbi:hypothetical protein WI0192307A02_CDS0003 [Pseudomonas phage KG853]
MSLYPGSISPYPSNIPQGIVHRVPLIRGIAPRVPQKSILSSGVFREYPPRVPQANVGVALSSGV